MNTTSNRGGNDMKRIFIIWMSCMLILGVCGLSSTFVYGNTDEEKKEEVIVCVKPSLEEETYKEKDNQLFISKECDVIFDFDFNKDVMKAIQVMINDEIYLERHYAKPKQKEQIVLSSALCKAKIKKLSFQWLDGNDQLHTEYYQIVLDQDIPSIVSIQFHDEEIKNEKEWYGLDEETVKIKATDGKYGSGIQAVQWYTVNKHGEKSAVRNELVNEQDEARITLKAPFEGYLFVSAIDECKNGSNQERAKCYKSGLIHLYLKEEVQKASTIQVDCKDALKLDRLYVYPQKEVKLPLHVRASLDGIKKLEYFIFDQKGDCIKYKDLLYGNQNAQCQKTQNQLMKVNTSISLQQTKEAQRIRVKLETMSGLIKENEIQVLLDGTNPQFKYTKSRQGSYIDGEQILHFEVKEDHFQPKQESLSIFVNEKKKVFPWQYDEESKCYVANVVCVEEGNYRVEGHVYDLAKNKSEGIKDSFQIDNQKPEITFDQQEHKFICSDHNLDVNNTLVQVNRNGKEMKTKLKIDGDNKKQILVFQDYNSWLDGYYTVEVKANDFASHETKQIYEMIKNTKGSKISCNCKNQVYKELKEVEITEQNLSPVENMVVFLTHKGKVKKLDMSDYQVQKKHEKPYVYVYRLNPTLFKEDGNYQIYIHSKDKVNNQNHWNQPFEIDRSAPKIAIVKENKGKQTLYVQDHNDIASVMIAVDGKKVEYQKQDETYTFEAKNPKNIRVEVKDRAGNVTNKEWKEEKKDSKQAFIPMILILFILLLIIVIACRQKKCK